MILAEPKIAWINPSEHLVYRASDPLDIRLSPTDAEPTEWALVGYPDDEGIAAGKGRVGARFAPDRIRRSLYRMTLAHPRLADHGNLSWLKADLAQRHQFAQTKTEALHRLGKRVISLGGGHDYGYPDATGFLEVHKEGLIINMDAHLDVRSTEFGPSSGTPFFRVLSERPHTHLYEVGYLSVCNSDHHFKWISNFSNVRLFPQTFATDSWSEAVLKEASVHAGAPCFLSVDMDAFSDAIGCSASWPLANSALDFIRFVKRLRTMADIRHLGIYEVSPPLDIDDRTSKLAAQIIAAVIE